MWIFCGVFATCSFCVRYVFVKQKYGFCRVKVWFLACKKGGFALQKYGFCFLNVMLLQIVRTHFVVECGKFRKAYMRFIVSRMHINLQNKWRIPIVNFVIYNVFNTASVGFGICMDTKNMPPQLAKCV